MQKNIATWPRDYAHAPAWLPLLAPPEKLQFQPARLKHAFIINADFPWLLSLGGHYMMYVFHTIAQKEKQWKWEMMREPGWWIFGDWVCLSPPLSNSFYCILTITVCPPSQFLEFSKSASLFFLLFFSLFRRSLWEVPTHHLLTYLIMGGCLIPFSFISTFVIEMFWFILFPFLFLLFCFFFFTPLDCVWVQVYEVE